MKLNCDLEKLKLKGVYKIENLVNNKKYIGSASVTLLKRMWHHQAMLRINKHKNPYLQSSFNKYGEDNFSFEILEICEKEECLSKEQYWMDYYQSHNMKIGYNINPKATNVPSTDRVTIDKRRATMKKRYASGEIVSNFHKGHTPWNKGKDGSVIDYSYLKGITKTITEKSIKARKQNNENRRNLICPEIYVYDINYKFLGKWNCAKDLEEWSLTLKNKLPIKSRFQGDRMGKPVKLLQSVNINKSCNYGKPYKNLYFSIKPLHQVIDDKK
jgi:group I intron endonuclease